MLLLGPEILNIISIRLKCFQQVFNGEWGNLFDSDDGDILNYKYIYISLQFLSFVLEVVIELSIAD